MSCKTFSRKNTIKNNMLMSRMCTKHIRRFAHTNNVNNVIWTRKFVCFRSRHRSRCRRLILVAMMLPVVFRRWCWLYCCHSLWHPVCFCCCYLKFTYTHDEIDDVPVHSHKIMKIGVELTHKTMVKYVSQIESQTLSGVRVYLVYL